ncbi:hypothetical protein [Roseateles sp.]
MALVAEDSRFTFDFPWVLGKDAVGRCSLAIGGAAEETFSDKMM